MKKVITLSAMAFLSTVVFANTEADSVTEVAVPTAQETATQKMQAQVDALTAKVEKLEKKQKRTTKSLTAVKKHDGHDHCPLECGITDEIGCKG